MMTDPVADMLTRLRNAAMAKHVSTTIPLGSLDVHLAVAESDLDAGRHFDGQQSNTRHDLASDYQT